MQRVRRIAIMLCQLVVAGAAVMLAARSVHFLTHAPPPEPGPFWLFLFLLLTSSVLLILLCIFGVRRPFRSASDRRPDAAVIWVIVSTLGLGFLTFYGLVFVWINTYGE